MRELLAPRKASENDLVAGIDDILGLKTNRRDTRQTFKIGDLAREFGVTLRTLRFYEDRGLLNPERRGTTRLYTRRDRMRLRLIQLAKVLGFSLTEAKQMIEIYDQPDGRRRQLEVALERFAEQQKILVDQRDEIEASLKAMELSLKLMRKELSKVDE